VNGAVFTGPGKHDVISVLPLAQNQPSPGLANVGCPARPRRSRYRDRGEPAPSQTSTVLPRGMHAERRFAPPCVPSVWDLTEMIRYGCRFSVVVPR
jgi:hypothetical protein